MYNLITPLVLLPSILGTACTCTYSITEQDDDNFSYKAILRKQIIIISDQHY